MGPYPITIMAQENTANPRLQPTLSPVQNTISSISTLSTSPNISTTDLQKIKQLSELKNRLKKANINASISKKELLPTLTKSEKFIKKKTKSVPKISPPNKIIKKDGIKKQDQEKNKKLPKKEHISPLKKTVKKIIPPPIVKEAIPAPTAETIAAFGISATTFSIDSVRHNPIKSIKTLPGIYVQFKSIRLNYGFNKVSEPVPTEIHPYIRESNLSNHFFQLTYEMPLTSKANFESSFIYLNTSGQYLGMDIEKSKVVGLLLGINYQLLTYLNVHFTIAPIIKNEWQFKQNTGDSIYEGITGKKLETTHLGNVFMLSLTWDIKNWKK